jgi:DNA-binding transcriptional ArsR family regulator
MDVRTGGNSKNEYLYERQAMVCKAFANPTRIHILNLLGRRERSVSELQTALGVSKANLSQHLGILRTTGAVVTHRRGKRVYCELAHPEIRQACLLFRKVLRRLRSR